MISVYVYKNSFGIYRFKLKNHGDPIVCAGVSALAITCVNFLQERLRLECELKHDKNSGFIDFAIPQFENKTLSINFKNAQLIIENMLYGLKLIEQTYYKQIEIINR